MIERPEAELIDRCRQGSEEAFADLVVKYQKPVYNIALRITHSRVLAEDVAQATFVKVYEKLASYRSEFPFFTWLYRIATNEAINEFRRKRHHSEFDESRFTVDNSSSFELTDAVQQALMLLQPGDRALIVLRHFQGLHYRDIACIVNRSESHVKSQLFRARHSLKMILSRMGFKNEK